MSRTKRQSEEEKSPSKCKHVSAAKMKSRHGVVPNVSFCYIDLLWHVRVSNRSYFTLLLNNLLHVINSLTCIWRVFGWNAN